MRRILGSSAVLGLFSILQSLLMLLIAMQFLYHGTLGINSHAEVQTVVFLQLVTGGHLLIFVARAEKWFFVKPYPAWPLVLAILGTQVLALLRSPF